jgi:mannosyltransferase OCH1-like enzyme
MNIIKLATRNELNTRHNEKKRNNVLEKIKQTNQSLLTLPSIQKFNTNSKLVESLPRVPPQVQPGVPPQVQPGVPPQVQPPQVQPGVPPQVPPQVPPPQVPPQVQPGGTPPGVSPPQVPPQVQPRAPPQVQPRAPPPELPPPQVPPPELPPPQVPPAAQIEQQPMINMRYNSPSAQKHIDKFDIVIPVGFDDIDIIKLQITCTKVNIKGYRNIYLIYKDTSLHIDGCITISESIYPFTINTVKQFHGDLKRNRWYLQQLLKLYAGIIIPDILDKYLVLESNTFFLIPTYFIDNNNKSLYNYSREYHKPHFDHIRKLHPSFKKIFLDKSGISHHMIFETKYIIKIFELIESLHNDSFYNVFLKSVEHISDSGASEYELYFNYMLQYYGESITLRTLKWQDVKNTYNMHNNEYISIQHWYNENSPIVYQSKIPLKFYQTWKTKELSTEFQSIVDTWKIHNPHYTYDLFDDRDAGQFIKDNFDKDVYDVFNKLTIGAFKADLFRYCVLYINGGVYADIDTICMNNLDLFLKNDIEFATPIDFNTNHTWGKYNLFNAFMASIPRHPILLDCINRVVYNVKNNIKPSSSVDLTGPGVLGRATNVFLNLNETTSFVNREGIINNILLLKFEQETEYVKNNEGDIVFQNKNGNKDIKRIYDNESKKNNMIPDWDSEYSIRGCP